jgi:hypothetical protein
MSNPSNLYAEKIFAEHPIALWPLDEDVNYLSLISSTDRDISTWNLEDCSVSENTSLIRKIASEPIYEISSEGVLTFNVNAPQLIDKYISQDLGSITIGFYFYTESTNLTELEIGYTYDSPGDPKYVDDAEYSESFIIKEYGSWQYVSKTFPIPQEELFTISLANNDLSIVAGQPTKVQIDSHGFSDGDMVKINVDYDVPSNLNEYSTFYVVNATANEFEIENVPGSGGIEFGFPAYGDIYLSLVKSISPFVRYTVNSYLPNTSYIHALSIGQWSSEFSEYSVGSNAEEISGINIPEEYYGIRATSYGLYDIDAYYLARENKLLAKNNSIPMVYGSSNLTSILPERFGGPSLIFPGEGFLNESGRYKTFTLEIWLRISPDTKEARRIFGPINSSDGIYVDGPFITLKVGNAVQSHYVGEWYRPMLLNIILFNNGAALTINGETVLKIEFDTNSIELPAKYSLSGKDQDWLGFYSYSDIFQFEIDCIAIYSYRVPTVMSKKRWIYGQAVSFPENVAPSYLGKSFPVDYTFANYSNNHIYPDMASWRNGIAENISYKNNVLQPPNYQLPKFIFNNKTSEDWYLSLEESTPNAISLKPDDSWSETDGYIFFDQVNILEQKINGFYGIFEAPVNFSATETLFKLQNQSSGNYLEADICTEYKDIENIDGTQLTSTGHKLKTNDIIQILINVGEEGEETTNYKSYFVTVIDEDTFEISSNKEEAAENISDDIAENIFKVNYIQYSLKFNSDNELLIYRTPAITLGHSIVAGIHFNDFANYFGGNIETLLGNKKMLKLYVGGNQNFNKTFSGKIYAVGFCTERNLNDLDYLFDNKGIPFLRYQFDNKNPAYGLVYDPDTDKNVYDLSYYDIADAGYLYEEYVDNILSHTASYTLGVKNFFGQRYLDVATSSYWQDYVPLSFFAKNIVNADNRKYYTLDFIQYNADITVPETFDENNNFDTSRKIVKSYISFQPVSAGPVLTENYFTNTVKASRSKVVQPDENWLTTKYEVVNGSIIYLPPNIDINDIAIVTHISIKSSGIIKNPIRVRSVQLAGKALNSLTSNPIQTRFGVSVYPYTKYGVYFNYKDIPPYLIYKDNTPHLYLTKNSGLELTGNFASSNSGISLPINKERVDNYYLSTLQFSMRFTRDDIVQSPKEIIQIDNGLQDDLIKIWIAPSLPANRRFKIYATDRHGNEINNVLFYINGLKNTNPVISKYDWNMISIALVDTIDMSNKRGRVNFVGPILFNNVSYYALNSAQKSQLDFGLGEYVGIDPAIAYSSFIGTNKIITGDDIDLSIKNYQYSILNDLNVQSATIKPV